MTNQEIKLLKNKIFLNSDKFLVNIAITTLIIIDLIIITNIFTN